MPGRSGIRITPHGVRALSMVVRADRAAAMAQLAQLEPGDRQVLADAVEVLRRLLDNASAQFGRDALLISTTSSGATTTCSG